MANRLIAPRDGKRCCDGGLKTLGYAERIAGIGNAFQQNREFVPAHAGQHGVGAGNLVSRSGNSVVVAQTRGQAAAKLHDDLIACHRTQSVVERLEIVEVHQKDGVLVVGVSARANEGTLQAVQQQAAAG